MTAHVKYFEHGPDLRHRVTTDPFGEIPGQHPPPHPRRDVSARAALNAMGPDKRARFEEAVACDDHEAACLLLNHPYGINFLWKHRDRVSPEFYHERLAYLWKHYGDCWDCPVAPQGLFGHRPESRRHFMDPGEQRFLDRLPPVFRVYRGFVWGHICGWSWTVSYHRANWFAHRFDDQIADKASCDSGVATGLVRKEDVAGVLLGLNDLEIVVDPRKVQNVRRFLPDGPSRDALHLDAAHLALQGAERASILGPHSYHGRAHWLKVDHNAIELCRRVPGADLLVCRLFAFWHDCRRKWEDEEDEGHGDRAADYVEDWSRMSSLGLSPGIIGRLTAGLNPGQLGRLLEACRWHEFGWTCKDPTIAVCWDADRLDLIRVGTIPRDSYLSTAAARELKLLI